jgi:hypothetical protein
VPSGARWTKRPDLASARTGNGPRVSRETAVKHRGSESTNSID